MQRSANAFDEDAILGALLDLRDAKQGIASLPWCNEERVRFHIQRRISEGQVIIVDDCFAVMFDIGAPWFAKADFLIEELVIRIRDYEYSPRRSIEAMEDVAKYMGLAGVICGDTQSGVMVPYYKAAGFVPLGTQLYKEIN